MYECIGGEAVVNAGSLEIIVSSRTDTWDGRGDIQTHTNRHTDRHKDRHTGSTCKGRYE